MKEIPKYMFSFTQPKKSILFSNQHKSRKATARNAGISRIISRLVPLLLLLVSIYFNWDVLVADEGLTGADTTELPKQVKRGSEQKSESSSQSKTSNTWTPTQPTSHSVVPRPYVGARDVNGNLDYTFDPSPSRFAKYVDTSSIKAFNDTETARVPILPKFQKGLRESQKLLEGLPEEKIPKILCIVYTYEKDHDVLEAVRNTWANKCDGFFAASNKTVESLGAVDLIHDGEESYKNMWAKTKSILLFAHDNYLGEYDFFYICGVDMFVLVDNLRAYLASDDYLRYNDGYRDEFSSRDDLFSMAKRSSELRPRPLLVGMPFPVNFRRGGDRDLFASGGNGYVLNQAALSIFNKLDMRGSSAFKFWNVRTSQEDVILGGALERLGVITVNTQDREGGWRFFGKCIEYLHKFDGRAPERPGVLYKTFNVKTPTGMDAYSAQTVSFHLKDCNGGVIESIYRYQSYFYGQI